MANLDLCGLDLKIINLDAAQKEIEKAIADLASGIGDISSVSSKLTAALGQLESLIPDVKIELPNLQNEINTLLSFANDPVQYALQLARIEELFGNIPTLDLDGLISQISLPNFNICSGVPNIDVESSINKAGETVYTAITKGVPASVPTVDAIKLPTPPIPKLVSEVIPVTIKSNSRSPVTSEVKTKTQTLTPPATNSVPATPPETTTVEINSLYNELTIPITNSTLKKTFIKTQAPDGSGYFWKPKGYSTQLELEAWVYTNVIVFAINSKEVLNTIIANPSSAPSQEFVDAYTLRLQNCVKFLKANGESNLTQATKNSDGTYSVSIEQAKKSFCPKPDGEWLGNWGIKAI